jgi:hypothetical protein
MPLPEIKIWNLIHTLLGRFGCRWADGRARSRTWFIQFGMASGSRHAGQVAVPSGRYVSSTCARTVIGLSVRSSCREGGVATVTAQPACARRRLPAWLLSCGGGVSVDGQSDGPVAEIGDEVQSASEGLDAAGNDLGGGDLAVLDLGDLGDAHGSASGYEHSNVSVATRLWEPNWEPTTTGTGPRRATSSHYRRSWTARQATPGDIRRHYGNAS